MIGNKDKYNLRGRLLKFSKRALEVCKTLPRLPECDVIRRQLASAATLVGANYEEADGAVAKRGFLNKMATSRKEANEVRYWHKIISGTYLCIEEVKIDLKEPQEIRNILSSIINNSRRKH